MGRKRRDIEQPGGVLSEESENSVDTVDQINRDIGFLKETLKLVQVASLGHEEWWDISLVHVTEEMLVRLERVGKLCNRFLEPGSKEKGKS